METMTRATGLAWQSTPGGYVGALCDGVPESVALDSLAAWAQQRPQPIAGLVIQDLRGGLDAARSACLRRMSEALGVPIVVLTDSPLVRGAVACQWLGARVCAFAQRDCERAFDQLQVPDPERDALRSALRALKVAREIHRTAGRRARSSDSSAA
jgi:hypothetical protein